jgi:hypothetical protein
MKSYSTACFGLKSPLGASFPPKSDPYTKIFVVPLNIQDVFRQAALIELI